MGQLLMAIPLLIYWVQFGAPLGARQTAVTMMMSSLGLSLAYLVFSIAAIGFHNAVIAQTDATTRRAAKPSDKALSIGFRLLGRAFLLGVLVGHCRRAAGRSYCFSYWSARSTMVRLIVGAVAFVVVCYAVGKIILGAVILIVEDKGALRIAGPKLDLDGGTLVARRDHFDGAGHCRRRAVSSSSASSPALSRPAWGQPAGYREC